MDVFEILKKFKFDVSNEYEVQKAIEAVLNQNGIVYKREFTLDRLNRVDFLIGNGMAIEVKIDGWSPMRIYKQLERYAKFDAVKEILLVSGQAIHMPEKIKGKSVKVLKLWSAWL